jgi:hypothetical protein
MAKLQCTEPGCDIYVRGILPVTARHKLTQHELSGEHHTHMPVGRMRAVDTSHRKLYDCICNHMIVGVKGKPGRYKIWR